MMARPLPVLADCKVTCSTQCMRTKKGESNQDEERIQDTVQDIEDDGFTKDHGATRPADSLVRPKIGRRGQGTLGLVMIRDVVVLAGMYAILVLLILGYTITVVVLVGMYVLILLILDYTITVAVLVGVILIVLILDYTITVVVLC